jgi:hypothetical protein
MVECWSLRVAPHFYALHFSVKRVSKRNGAACDGPESTIIPIFHNSNIPTVSEAN